MPRARKSDAVKLKELEVLQSVIANPLVLYVAGFTTIEVLQKYDIVGEVMGTTAEFALSGIAIATALGPSLGSILSGVVPGGGEQIPGSASGGILDKIKALLPG